MWDLVEKGVPFLRQYPTWIKIYAAVVVFLLVGLLVSMVFARTTKRPENCELIPTINDLWPCLMADIHAAPPQPGRRLEVLGLTLYAAWGQLLPWIKESTTASWEVHFYSLSPKIARAEMATLVPEQWAKDSESKAEAIAEFLSQYQTDLDSRQVKVVHKHFSSFPAIHGFRLPNGKIYMSHIHWSAKDGKVDYDAHPYEVIEANDKSERARIYRNVFLNWLDRAGR